MIKCTQCGFDNLPGHLHCTKCKQRLNLEQITREYFAGLKTHIGYGREIFLGCAVIFLAVCVLALWPNRGETIRASEVEQANARNKLKLLQKGLAREPLVFSEKEVNILFDYLLQEMRRKPAGAPETAIVDTGWVTIRPDAMTVHISYRIDPWSFGPLTIGPFWYSYEATGVPEKRHPDGLCFVASKGAIGHLALPWLGRSIAMARLRKLFQPFKNARAFLSSLEIIDMNKGSLTISEKRR